MSRRLVGTVVSCAALALGACGAGADRGPAAAPPPPSTASTLPSIAGSVPDAPTPAPPPAPSAAGVLPALTVDDVGAGSKVELASLSPSSQPLLVWLWAPH